MAQAPRWVGLVSFLTVVTAASHGWFLATTVGQLALVDQWERTSLAFGRDIDDAAYARLREWSRSGPAYGVASAIAAGPLLTFAVAAGVYMLLGRRAVGSPRDIAFPQVLAVAAHASVILAIRQVVAAPVGFVRETTASATSLGVLMPVVDATSPIARFAGALDLFVVWWLLWLGMGIAVLYGRRAPAIVLTFLGVYAGVALLLAATMTALGGTA